MFYSTFNLPPSSVIPLGTTANVSVLADGNLTLKSNGTNRRVQWLDGKIETIPAINQGVLGLSGSIPNTHTVYETQYASGLKGTVDLTSVTGSSAKPIIKY